MNETTCTPIAKLESMRLPELQARYAEVVGETTRCPNRRFLIRRITEALTVGEVLEARAAEPPKAGGAAMLEGRSTDMDVDQPRSIILGNIDPTAYTTAEQDNEEIHGRVEPTAMPEPLVEAAESFVESAAAAEPSPDNGSDDFSTPLDSQATMAIEPTPAEPTPTEPAPARKLSKLTVPELQVRYLEVVGRPTSSSDRNYLVWKVRQAEKGKIPVGPRAKRRSATEPQEIKVLPLRMEASLVARLDEARERLGLKSRMDLIRRALGAYLAGVGEDEVAARLAPEA